MGKGARPHVSYADLCQQPEDGRRYELYDGEVFVVPSPLPLHQIVAMNVADWLRHHHRTRDGLTLSAPLDIVLTEHDVVQPDIVYFERARLGELSSRSVIRVPPDVAIEVLSSSTASSDRGRKRQLLARYRVREYWLIDPDAEQVEVYTLQGDNLVCVQQAHGDDTIRSPLLGDPTAPVANLFRSPI